jgi:branched-chain amino acid aminotransferase
LSTPFVMVNGALVAADKAFLKISDLSIQRGYGIFDFFKTLNGRPIFLEDHLDRFYFSAAQMRLNVKESRDELKVMLSELMQQNNLPDSGVRITLTGGYSADGYMMDQPNMIITQQPLVNTANLAAVKLITHRHQRQMPHIKTIDYLMAIWLQPLIKEQDADDVLYCNNNIVTECPRANFFVVTNEGTVATTATNLLKGIVRLQLLRHFSKEFMIEERDVTLEEVYDAKEAFITSSTKNILSVASVDGRLINDGKPGEITTLLAGKLKELIKAC